MDLPFDVDEGPNEGGSGTLAAKVLLVDDELIILELLSEVLAHEPDIAVTTTETAEAALNIIKGEHFDVMITDKNLPGMGGIELIEKARAVRPTLEAMMITGYASAESLIAAMAAGACDYLVKPFDDIKLIRAKTRAALDRRVERSKNREIARTIAKQAADLMKGGKGATEPAWQTLEEQYLGYEKAIREGGTGTVLVIGGQLALDALQVAGIDAARVEPTDTAIEAADVVVIQTGDYDWRSLAERISKLPPHVVLLAGTEAGLPELLEAITLKLDLVGFGGHGTATLAEKVKAILMTRAVEKSRARLAEAFAEFREKLKQAP